MESARSGDGSCRKMKNEEAVGISCSGKKHDLVVFIHASMLALNKSSLLRLPRLGQQWAHRTKTNMDEPDFRGSDAETSERTCRSGDVRVRGLGHQVATVAHLDFEGQVRVDMRYVCPKDVNNVFLGQARSTYWRKWAAKHENVEVKDGIWLEPALALLGKKTKEGWTDKHRNVARKLVLEGCWVQKKTLRYLVGQKNSAMHVTKKKAEKSKGFALLRMERG